MIEGYDLVTKLFHMGERTKFDMTRPVPQISDTSQLVSLSVLEQFERITKEIIQTNDGEVALLARRVLEDKLLPRYPQMRQMIPEIYQRYQKIIGLLKFMNLVIYSRREIGVLVKENLLSVLQTGMLVKEKFQRVLDDYDDILMQGTIAEELANSMMVCEEKLGNLPILLKDENRPIPQTIGNWMKDYIQESLSGGEHSTGSLERISYLQKNPNAQKLNQEEKKILLQVFHLYDWLRYGEFGADQGSEDMPYITAQKFELPPDLEKTKSELSIPSKLPPSPTLSKPSETITPSPVVTPPSPRPVPRAVPSIRQAQDLRPSKPIQPPVAEAGASLQGRPVKDRRAFRPVNIQDILHRRSTEEEKVGGLKMGDGEQSFIPRPPAGEAGPSSLTQKPKQVEDSNLSVPSGHLPSKGEKNMEESIDKKLDELKKKLSK